jgi:hypothetical protein
MDISVSRLNNRLALQLPNELPLGLVFVLGRVQNLQQKSAGNQASAVIFDLMEEGHAIRCRLSRRAAEETVLEEGILIRAGGHLSFDPMQADYFLFARDVEIVLEAGPPTAVSDPLDLPSRLEKSGLGKVLTDVKKRSDAVKEPTGHLPDWVRRMAPDGVVSPEDDYNDEGETTAVSAIPSPPALDPKLVDFAAKAMESEEDVELTPALLDQLTDSPAPTPPAKVKRQEPTQNGTDWVVVGLLLLLAVLSLMTIGTFLLLWLG